MNSFIRGGLFCLGALLCCESNAQKADSISKKQKTVETVDFKSNKTVTVTYNDRSSETISESEANKKGLIHNGGYGNQTIVNSPTGEGITFRTKPSGTQPLYVLDGKEITDEEMKAINPETIESINVLKNKSAIDKYGVKGRNGVVEIFIKISNINKKKLLATDSSKYSLKKIINAQDNDIVASFTIVKGNDEDEVVKLDVVGEDFNDDARRLISMMKAGDTFIIQKIVVKRNGVITKLPAVVQTISR